MPTTTCVTAALAHAATRRVSGASCPGVGNCAVSLSVRMCARLCALLRKCAHGCVASHLGMMQAAFPFPLSLYCAFD